MNTFGFNRAEAQRLYGSVTGDLHAVQIEYDRLAQRKAGLEEMLAAILKIHPEIEQKSLASSPVAATRPKGVTSVDVVVIVVVEDFDGKNHLTVRQVMDGLESRRWIPEAVDPEAAVRTALSRATSQGRIERVKLDGRASGYRPRSTSAETVADTTVSETPIPTSEEGGGSHETAKTSAGEDHNDLHLGASGDANAYRS